MLKVLGPMYITLVLVRFPPQVSSWLPTVNSVYWEFQVAKLQAYRELKVCIRRSRRRRTAMTLHFRIFLLHVAFRLCKWTSLWITVHFLWYKRVKVMWHDSVWNAFLALRKPKKQRKLARICYSVGLLLPLALRKTTVWMWCIHWIWRNVSENL